MTKRAYHSSPNLKAAIVAEMRCHAELETLVKGHYWSHGRGCFIGCLIGSSDHAAAMERIGAPIALGRLCDFTFEGLPIAAARRFAVDILEAVPAGADLSMVSSQLMLWTMNRLLSFSEVGRIEDVKAALETVAALYQRRLNGDEPSEADWRKAANAADAADAAIWAAWAADTAAWVDSRRAFWRDFAAEMIRLVKNTAASPRVLLAARAPANHAFGRPLDRDAVADLDGFGIHAEQTDADRGCILAHRQQDSAHRVAVLGGPPSSPGTSFLVNP